jgi:hypothetical protein
MMGMSVIFWDHAQGYRPFWEEVHRQRKPWYVPPYPWWTRRIHHQQRPPRHRHWWPDQEVRCQMIIPLMTIPTFWISPWWCPGLLVGRAPYYRCTSLTQGNKTVWFDIPNVPIFALLDAGPTFLVLVHEDIDGGLWVLLRLAPLIFLPLAIFRTCRIDHPLRPLLS